jgi:hypothetical protein
MGILDGMEMEVEGGEVAGGLLLWRMCRKNMCEMIPDQCKWMFNGIIHHA